MRGEVESLNAQALDVAELEHRVELAGLTTADCWSFTCGTNTCTLDITV